MFLPHNPKEKTFFPVDLDDIIPEGSPVRLISDVVDGLNLRALEDSYANSKEGRRGYHPAMMLKSVVYGYMNNIYSSRMLEEAMRRDAHLIWISCYQCPDHTTINNFKNLCRPMIKDIFSQIVTVLVQMGEVDLADDLYIDGTTIRSRAARKKIKWRKNAEKYSAMADDAIQQGVEQLLKQIEEGETTDMDAEAARFTTDQARRIADEVGKRLGAGRPGMGQVNAVRDACDRKDTHDAVLEKCAGRCGIAPEDPDCGIMHAKEDGYDSMATPNYNVQAATQNQYVTNYDVFDTPSDKDTALPFIDTCISENGKKPRAVVEDAGYGCEEVYVGLRKREIDAVVKFPNYDSLSTRKAVKEDEFDRFGFRLGPGKESVECPAGHVMEVVAVTESWTKSGFPSPITTLKGTACGGCAFAARCTAGKDRDHQIKRRLGNMREEEIAKENLDKPHNKEKLRRRSLEPEPVFGQLKHNKGYQRFRHFGKSGVTMDLGFMFIALNLLKLHRNLQKTV